LNRNLSRSRFAKVKEPGSAHVLPPFHPAMIENRPLFAKRATEETRRQGFHGGIGVPLAGENVIKAAENNRKIHSASFLEPIGTITLRERTDCPLHCPIRDICYGNSMPWARRFIVGPEFYAAVQRDCELWSLNNPSGWRLRLHVLGDFNSVTYVRFWARMLAEFAPLKIYGYTAWRSTDPIGREIDALNRKYEYERFCVRFSNSTGPWSTRVFRTVSTEHIRDGHMMCLHEIDGRGCADCKACWQSPVPIGFTAH
jgi:hypothetical protein